MVNFQNATLLSYNHRNNFGGGEVFRTGSVKEISVKGFIQSKTQNKDLEGVKEAQLQIQDFIDVANDWEDITINGHNFGKGKITSISFASSASTFTDNIRFAEFDATVEIPTSVNGDDELYNLRGETYRGVLSSVDRTSSALSDFDESFDFNIEEDNTYSYNHSLTVNFISGVQPEMIADSARYDGGYYFIKNLESDEKYQFAQADSEVLKRIDTSADIMSSDGEFTPIDPSEMNIALRLHGDPVTSRLGSAVSSTGGLSSNYAIDNSDNFTFFQNDTASGGEEFWEIDLGCNIYDLTKIYLRNIGFEVVSAGNHSVANGITISVEALEAGLPDGYQLWFENNAKFTLTSAASAGATSLEGNLQYVNIVVGDKGNIIHWLLRRHSLNNFRISVFEEGYTSGQDVAGGVLATSYAKYLTYSSDHYNTDDTIPEPDFTLHLPAGVYGRHIRVQWVSKTTTGGGTTRDGSAALGFSKFKLYSSRSIVKVYNPNVVLEANPPVKTSVKLIKADPIRQSKRAARRIFEARPALGFIDAKYSGYYQVTGKSLYSETYDLSNHTCSFGKSFSSNQETGTNYSVKYDHTLSIGEDGISVITENGTVKGREVPFFSKARTAAETEIQNSYSRVTGMFSGYCAGYNAGSYFLPYASGLNHGPSGMADGHVNLFDRPTNISRVYNSGEGSVGYSVTYSNDPKITGGYFCERNVSISKDQKETFSVQEDGTITLYQSRRISPQSLKDLYTATEGDIKTRCQKELNDYRSKTNDYTSMTLNAVSSRINFQAHGKTLTYTKGFSDDKTLIDSNNLKKFSMSISDSPPIYISTDYQVPNFGKIGGKNGYTFNQKGNYATMGRRTIKCNGILRRVNTHNHLDIYSSGFTTNNLISYDGGDTSGLSVMTALKYMSTECKAKAREVWSNFGLNKNKFREIYVSDVSYSFNSDRVVTFTMSFDYAGGRSDIDLAYRDGGLIENVINDTT